MTFPHPIKGVVFDMDGLLCDTEVVYRDSMMEEAAAHGRELPFSVIKKMIGLPSIASDAVAAEHFGPGFDMAAWDAGVTARVKVRLDAGVALKAGVIEILDLLDFLRLPRAIATSSSHRSVATHIGHTGITSRFTAIIARGDYANGKPAPDPFLRAAEAIGVPAIHCVALEDSHNGVRSAAAAGMMTIMVPDLLEPTEEMHGLVHSVQESLHHVRELIEAAAR